MIQIIYQIIIYDYIPDDYIPDYYIRFKIIFGKMSFNAITSFDEDFDKLVRLPRL